MHFLFAKVCQHVNSEAALVIPALRQSLSENVKDQRSAESDDCQIEKPQREC